MLQLFSIPTPNPTATPRITARITARTAAAAVFAAFAAASASAAAGAASAAAASAAIAAIATAGAAATATAATTTAATPTVAATTKIDLEFKHDMATLPCVLNAFSNLQKSVVKPKLVTKFGRITIALFELMSYAGIEDEDLLLLYEEYIRKDPQVSGFRSVVSLTFSNSRRGRYREFTFSLSIENNKIDQLLILYKSNLPITETLADSPVVARRSSSKKAYSPSTLTKYSRAIEVKINGLLDSEMPDTNAELRLQVVNDVLQRLNPRDESKSKVDIGKVSILGNIKSLVTSMRLHGNNDREQHNFFEYIALAVSGDLSVAFLEASTGLSREMIERGRTSRVTFEELVSTAENNEKEKILLPINEANRNLQEDYESEDETGDNSSVDSDSDEIQAGDSNKRKRSNTNIFREHFSSKSRKLRNDKINGSEVQLFCHERENYFP